MLVIKILAGLAIIFALYISVSKFNNHCSGLFGHAFFTRNAFLVTVASLVFLIVGNMWRQSAAVHHGDVLNGTVVMLIGAGITFFMIYSNIKRTNLVYGIGGSVVQLGLFFALAYISIPFVIIGLFCYFFTLASAKPVYIVNR